MRGSRRGGDGTRPGLPDWLPWLPTVLGVAVLLVILVLAGLRLTTPGRGPEILPAPAAAPPEPSPASAPSTSGEAIGSASATVTSASPSPAGTSATAHRDTPRPAATRTRARASRPVPGPVTGRYRVVQSWSDGFIGEVLVGNTGSTAADWVVQLRFPETVGVLYSSWVESAPQATLSRAGAAYVWRSGALVQPGSSVALRFEFARQGGADRPQTCTVNGTPCRSG
jgi:hypothetical protein